MSNVAKNICTALIVVPQPDPFKPKFEFNLPKSREEQIKWHRFYEALGAIIRNSLSIPEHAL